MVPFFFFFLSLFFCFLERKKCDWTRSCAVLHSSTGNPRPNGRERITIRSESHHLVSNRILEYSPGYYG